MAEASMTGAYTWESGSLLTPTRMNLRNKAQLAQYELLGRETAGTGNAERIASTAAHFAMLGLSPAADKLPYFSGTTTAALADLTSTARLFLAVSGKVAAANFLRSDSSLAALTGTYALDFAAYPIYGGQMTGNTTFTASNYGSGRVIRIYTFGATSYTFTFPSGWKWVGGKPTSKTANKYGLIELMCVGSVESAVIARYTEET